jgi:hypothetical protein
MGKKLTYKDVKDYIDNDLDNETILLTTENEYINTTTNMKFICKCGNEFETTFTYFKSENKKQCNSCGAKKRNNDTRLTYAYVKSYIEGEEGNGCKLLSQCYENNMTLLKIQCSCGNEFTTIFREFKQGNKKQCNDCGHINKVTAKCFSYDEVKEYIEVTSKSGYKLLSEKYTNSITPLKMICDKGHVHEQRFEDFKQGHRCDICAYEIRKEKLKLSFEEVKEYIESQGYTLLSEKYINTKIKLDLICPNNHKISITYDSFKSGRRCSVCHKEKTHNELSPLKLYLRHNLTSWKRDSMSNCNYKCVITEQPFRDIHHLYSFDNIVKETMNEINLPIYEIIEFYSDDELNLIKEKCLELHYKYGFGVCITRELHKLFHNIYGKKNNTDKQFFEFTQRYKNGEFDNRIIINDVI